MRAMSSAERYRILLGTYGCNDIRDPGADDESNDPLRMELGQDGVANWGAPLSPPHAPPRRRCGK
jgi:hypothetical protein